MKSLLFSICFLFLSGVISAQNTNNCKTYGVEKAFVYSIGKKDKAKSTKDCIWVTICDHAVEFRASATSVMTVYKITESKWETEGGKVAEVVTQADGHKVFWVSDNKAFIIRP